LGSVVKVWKKNNAFGIKIEKGELLKDSRIAIEVPFPEEFYELQVTSIMINNKNVQSAESGDEVGISYNRDISEVKIGMRIFVIK
jgi:GTPase